MMSKKLKVGLQLSIGGLGDKSFNDSAFSGIQEAKEKLKQNTRRLAKKQGTWFRKDKRIRWIDVSLSDTPKQTALQIARSVNSEQ